MGTSTSSSGPGAGVPFDPPWLDALDGDDGGGATAPTNDDASDDGNSPSNEREELGDVAPPRRFANARRELGAYARSGSKEALGKALGHYSKTGMGGAKRTAARMHVSTRTAAGLVSFLQAARDGSDVGVSEWVSALIASNPSAQDVINEVIRQVTSTGGSLEEESCKDSMAQAMAELMEMQPDVDLLKMGNSDIWTLVELFLTNEACNRLQLDIGQLFESSKLAPREVVVRLNDMRDYLKAELSAQMRSLQMKSKNPTTKQLEVLMQNAIQNTFYVYEEEL